MGETLRETQARRFEEQLYEFLKKEFTKLKMTFSKDGILMKVKINYALSLNKLQLNSLIHLSDSWLQDIKMKRSGAGIVIEFNLNQ